MSKIKHVFVIGFLSSPIPYLLVAFLYLLGFSWGLFSKTENSANTDDLISNIVNYEELNADIDVSDENANYVEFLKEKHTANFDIIYSIFFNSSLANFEVLSPPEIDNCFYKFMSVSNLNNRPPPNFFNFI